MPRYDYRCADCRHEFELVQSFSEAGSGICPVCSGAGRRVFHAVPVIYKGSGFYTTDYARPKRQSENGAKETSDSKADTSDSKSGKEDSKSSSTETKSASSETKGDSTAKTTSEASTST